MDFRNTFSRKSQSVPSGVSRFGPFCFWVPLSQLLFPIWFSRFTKRTKAVCRRGKEIQTPKKRSLIIPSWYLLFYLYLQVVSRTNEKGMCFRITHSMRKRKVGLSFLLGLGLESYPVCRFLLGMRTRGMG